LTRSAGMRCHSRARSVVPTGEGRDLPQGTAWYASLAGDAGWGATLETFDALDGAVLFHPFS